MEKFTVNTPLKGEYFTTLRLTAGGLCALAGFNLDETEDFKVCVTESLLILKRNGFSSAEVEFTLGDALRCRIEGKECQGVKEDGIEDEISRALLSALLGKVNFVKDGEIVVRIEFEG